MRPSLSKGHLGKDRIDVFPSSATPNLNQLIRFTLLTQDPDSGSPQGILTAADELQDRDHISKDEHTRIRIALDWFNTRLPVPKPLEHEGTRRAISWFKPSAKEAISRMWDIKEILDYHNFDVEVVRTSYPGTIIYEDDFQVVAIPRKKAS